MRVRGQLVDWLVELDLTQYTNKVVYEHGVKVLYLEILRAIYGVLIESLLWYCKLRNNLEEKDFEFNPYNACVANRIFGKYQQTIPFHVDDLVCSGKNTKANNNI